MLKQFIRWILPVIALLVIATAIMIGSLSATHAAPAKNTQPPYSAPAGTTPTGPMPSSFWQG